MCPYLFVIIICNCFNCCYHEIFVKKCEITEYEMSTYVLSSPDLRSKSRLPRPPRPPGPPRPGPPRPAKKIKKFKIIFKPMPTTKKNQYVCNQWESSKIVFNHKMIICPYLFVIIKSITKITILESLICPIWFHVKFQWLKNCLGPLTTHYDLFDLAHPPHPHWTPFSYLLGVLHVRHVCFLRHQMGLQTRLAYSVGCCVPHGFHGVRLRQVCG